MKNLDFATIRETVKSAYNNGAGTFKECATAAGLEYIPAGKSQLTKRATPTIEANGRAYDFHAFLKACNIEIVKHERLTAGGERIPSQRSKVEKVDAAFVAFVNRIKEVCGVDFGANDSLNNLCKIAKKEAEKLDKQAEKERAEAIKRAKVEKQRKQATAKVESLSDEMKLQVAAAALGLSIDQIKAIQAQTKPAKVTK